jgi:hypothetical protein
VETLPAWYPGQSLRGSSSPEPAISRNIAKRQTPASITTHKLTEAEKL